jgi:hypothetical protein
MQDSVSLLRRNTLHVLFEEDFLVGVESSSSVQDTVTSRLQHDDNRELFNVVTVNLLSSALWRRVVCQRGKSV